MVARGLGQLAGWGEMANMLGLTLSSLFKFFLLLSNLSWLIELLNKEDNGEGLKRGHLNTSFVDSNSSCSIFVGNGRNIIT